MSRRRPPPPPSAPEQRTPSRLPMVFALLVGALIGRFAVSWFPSGVLDVFDLAVAAGIALIIAIAYRRFMRRHLERRRREAELRRRSR